MIHACKLLHRKHQDQRNMERMPVQILVSIEMNRFTVLL
jgi:hypothetical protein